MFFYPKDYDVIVIGAGHAGVEAALASARMGCETLMLTINPDTIGQMSCNPAIGGLAKGHLVREIDALGGEMGINTDQTGLQFRMLNKKKGPAVWAPRAQCDKKAYQFRLKWVCERQECLDIRQGQAVSILTKDGKVLGIESNYGVAYKGKTVVITTGTFLMGLMHVGQSKQRGGRSGESAASFLSQSLKNLGLELGRLKTGTPPRLLRKSINFDSLEAQHGDEPIPHFSYWPEHLFHVEHRTSSKERTKHDLAYSQGSIVGQLGNQMPCFITHTTKRTAEIVNAHLHESPMYSGVIEGVGPRYCPSIEDKIVKFSDKERHQVFLEPEGIATDEIYVNGLSTCLPFEVQIELVKSVSGLERAEILRPAYAVEYDFVNPTQVKPSLETKVCENLFLAGQINGTSGYEEAGAQGVMAGINAALRCQNRPSLVLRRDQAYIGVLIDDLVTKGTTEPYRMFTSRAEHRLLLRQDNADLRLSSIGQEVGLLGTKKYNYFASKRDQIKDEINRLQATYFGQNSLAQLLRRPSVCYNDLPLRNTELCPITINQIEISLKYAGYIDRQSGEVERFKQLEGKEIPLWVDYQKINSLRLEARQKLEIVRPRNLGQALRIPGVSPADVNQLMVCMKHGKNI